MEVEVREIFLHPAVFFLPTFIRLPLAPPPPLPLLAAPPLFLGFGSSANPHRRKRSRMEGRGFWQYMVAGSVAGMAEHMAMFPVDTLKTRMQTVAVSATSSCCPRGQPNVGRLLTSIVRSEGPSGLYRGIAAIGLGAGPAHAAYFTVYELCKGRLGGDRHDGFHHPLIHAASGVAATVASDTLLTPMDVVKQRLQLRSSPYSGVRDCVVRMLRDEGIKAFYASYRTTVLMNAPFTAVHFTTYEAVKKILFEISPENSTEEKILVHLTAGGSAGALASALTTPLDVVKTRLQCQVCFLTSFLMFDLISHLLPIKG